jgi:hypothetical protein
VDENWIGPDCWTKLLKNAVSETIGEGIRMPSEVKVVAACQIRRKTKIEIAAALAPCFRDLLVLSIILLTCL